MADDLKIDEGAGPKVATDEIGGKHHQRVKVQHGADGAATDVSGESPLPVEDAAVVVLQELALASLQALDNAVAGSELQVDVVASLPAGTNTIGKLGANSGVDIGDVDVASIAAGANAIGNVGLIPRTSGGLSIFRTLDLDETEEAVKEAAGQVYGYYFSNRTAAERFLKFYNATPANVTVGTTTPVLTLPLPKESAGHVPIPQGLAFSTAITVAATTGLADNDTGAPGANDVVLNVYFA